jgi:hypothetical protein
LALVNFDNSIEVSLQTYLTLNPIQRQESFSHTQTKDTERMAKQLSYKNRFLFRRNNNKKITCIQRKRRNSLAP